MICGISQSDHTLLVVPSRLDKFQENEEQILNQIELCKVFCIKQIIVAVNKMDDASVNFDMNAFKSIQQLMTHKFKVIGFRIEAVSFIPITAFAGDNLTEKSPNMPWWNGPTLKQLFDELEMPNRELHKPLRISIDHACAVTGVGTIVMGTVIQGVVFCGQNVRIGPIDINTQVKSLHLAIPKIPIDMGFPGDHVALCLRNVKVSDCHSRRLGMVTGFWKEEEQQASSTAAVKTGKVIKTEEQKVREAKEKRKDGPLHSVTSFTAKVLMWNPKGKIGIGYAPTLHVHNGMVPVKISAIKLVLGSTQSNEIELQSRVGQRDVDIIKKGETVLVEFQPMNRKLSIDTVDKCAKLGRILLREGLDIIGAGIVVDTFYGEKI